MLEWTLTRVRYGRVISENGLVIKRCMVSNDPEGLEGFKVDINEALIAIEV